MPLTGQRFSRASRAIDVVPIPDDGAAFDVTLREGKTETRHRVSLATGEAAKFAQHTPERIVRATMAFLLDREPRESILAAFDIAVVRRYFPEFDRALPDYLARLADSQA